MRFIHECIYKLDQYSEIIEALHNGHPVILPTETVYGIGILAEYKQKLCDIKQRPADMPVSIAYTSVNTVLQDFMHINQYQKLCIESLLPGPFTILINDQNNQKVGIRVPDHNICHIILSIIEKPILLSSANIHNQPPAINFMQAKQYFPDLCGIDGGVCKYSKPSMIIDITHTR